MKSPSVPVYRLPRAFARRLLRAQLRLKVMAGVVLVTLVALAAFDIGAMSIMRRNLLGQTDGTLAGALQAAQSRFCTAAGATPASGGAGGTASGAAGAKPGDAVGCLASGQVRARAGDEPVKPPYSPLFVPVSAFSITYLKTGGGQLPIQVGVSGGQQGGLSTLSPTAALLAAKPGAHTVLSDGAGGLAGGVQVRAVSTKVAGGILVASTPLSQVDQTITYFGIVVAAGSCIVVLLIAAGVFLVLRRGLRPIEAMAAQADRITAGDLTQRVASHHPRSEVGRLSTALNGMLARIQASVDERAASERHMRRFFADASHELRTPLASLRANAELYQQGAVPGGPGLDEVMRRITLETQRMSRLVDDMFRLARLGAQPVQSCEPVDLSALVESCADRARVAEPERAWRVLVAPGLWGVGDEELLRRAIDNLITNVHVHTPATATGTITAAAMPSLAAPPYPATATAPTSSGARTSSGAHTSSGDDTSPGTPSSDGGWVVIEVSDDGPGVPADKLPRIFERFYRAGAATVRPGSGLGLAIVAEIAAAHGGRATAAASSPAGLRVSLELPCSARTGRQTATGPGSAVPAAFPGPA